MKEIRCRLLLIVVLLFYCVPLVAQTINFGELSILSNTQLSIGGSFDNASSGTMVNDGEIIFYSHFNNDGLFYFLQPGGVSKFFGNALQLLTGIETSEFYDVVFDNAAPVDAFGLSGDFKIRNRAYFNRGVVNTTDFGGQIIFEREASQSAASNGSFVRGSVQKDGDSSFEFPIGDAGYYRPLGISAPKVSTDSYLAKYFFESPDAHYPLENRESALKVINDQEYWVVNRVSGSGSVVLTMGWDDSGTTSPLITQGALENIVIVRWDAVAKTWVNEGGIVDVMNKTVTTPLAVGKDGVFTLGRVDDKGMLPDNKVMVYNGISPNGDGINDYLVIGRVEELENNMLQVYNRWGVKVFETKDYGSHGNVFDGYSQSSLNLRGDKRLPTGTYFYVLTYDLTVNGQTNRMKQVDFLHITTQD